MEIVTLADPVEDGFFKVTPTDAAAAKIARRVPRDAALMFLASVDRDWRAAGHDLQAHVEMAMRIFRGTRRAETVHRYFTRRRSFLFGETTLTEALRHVLLHSPQEPGASPPEPASIASDITDLLIMSLSTIQAAVAADSAAGALDSDAVLRLTVAVSAEQCEVDFGTACVLRLLELEAWPEALAKHDAGRTAQSIVQAKTAVERELVTAGLACWIVTDIGPSPLVGASVFPDSAQIRWELAGPALVGPPEDLVEAISADGRTGLVRALRRRPLIAISQDVAVVGSRRELGHWMSDGVQDRVEHDLAGIVDDPAAIRGDVVELALRRWVSELDPATLCCSELVVSGEESYNGVDGGRRDSSDLYLCCPHATVMVELQSGAAVLDTRKTAAERVEIAGTKSRQMITPAGDLGVRFRPDGFHPDAPRRAVVIDARIPMDNSGIHGTLLAAIEAPWKELASTGVASLQVFEMADWVRLLGAVENAPGLTVGAALATMADRGIRPGLVLGSPEQFVDNVFRGDWRRPSALERRVQILMDQIAQLLFPRFEQ